jgi:branched-chain amino acid transport system ATP-binding protein
MSEFNFGEILGVSLVLFGFAAFLMGQAIAETWRPAWQNVGYGLLLALGNHFIDCALFGGDWLSISHYLLDAVIIIAIALFAHRVTLVRKMVQQYPWLYERNGLLSWRERTGSGAGA